jgi:hypothetical protein
VRDGERHSREGLVDLDALDIGELPAAALQRLADGRDRAETEYAGFDRRRSRSDRPTRRTVPVVAIRLAATGTRSARARAYSCPS